MFRFLWLLQSRWFSWLAYLVSLLRQNRPLHDARQGSMAIELRLQKKKKSQPILKNRLYYLEQFQVCSKIERKVQRVPTPPPMPTLPASPLLTSGQSFIYKGNFSPVLFLSHVLNLGCRFKHYHSLGAEAPIHTWAAPSIRGRPFSLFARRTQCRQRRSEGRAGNTDGQTAVLLSACRAASCCRSEAIPASQPCQFNQLSPAGQGYAISQEFLSPGFPLLLFSFSP